VLIDQSLLELSNFLVNGNPVALELHRRHHQVEHVNLSVEGSSPGAVDGDGLSAGVL
jgi:hypothetical protein